MNELHVVVLKIFAMFLVMALGWAVRRMGYLSEIVGRALSRLLVDVIFPALVFTQMLKTVNMDVLRAGWYVPAMGFGIMVVAAAAGLALMPLFSGHAPKSTAVFLSATPNWIYLPLPIVQALFGDAGVRDILLFNVGCQLALWSIGIGILRASMPDLNSFRMLLVNPGLLATAAGIVLALCFPALGVLGSDLNRGMLLLPAAAAFQGLDMLGSLTIPLSLIITGVQLGGLNLADHMPSVRLVGVLLVRLVVAPLATVVVVRMFLASGAVIGEVARLTGYLIAAMPVAISCSIVADRFNGDTALAAKSIFYSTLLSLVTVPSFYFIIRYFNL